MDVFDPLVILPNIELLANCIQLVLHPVGGAFQQELKLIGTELFQILVRILSVPHLQHLHLQAGLFQNGNRPLGRPLTGFVAIINQHHLIGILGQQVGTILRQRRTQRCHSAVEAILMQGDGIHVAFHQNQVALLTLLRQIQSEEVLALVKNQGFRGIEVFGSLVILFHDATAESDYIAPHIDDGKHQPVPEPVEEAAVLF